MRDQVLTETDTIQVPFYPLEALASKDFDGSYSFGNADGTVNAKPVVVNKRKYQPLEFTSKQLARNSVVDLGKIMMLKAEKLAEDILNDIWSVVTAANFGAAIFTGAANTFDRDDVADLRPTLSQANWPMAGRALVLESAYEGNVTKSLTALQNAGDEPLREGVSGRVAGFDLYDHPNMPGNGENLVGAAVLPYAILTAFAPIPPAEEVAQVLTAYRKYVDKDTLLTLEYRAWGDPNSDSVKRVIECSYGSAKGDTDQLKRLVSA
jgi:hypothetical protein